MTAIIGFVLAELQDIFGGFVTKMSREALGLAIKLVIDHFDGDPELTPENRLKTQGLILEALKTVGFHGVSSTEGGG